MTKTAQGVQITQRTEYEAIGDTLDEALTKAHDAIPPPQGSDFTTSRVVDWGMQFGGWAQTRKYWVRVVQEIVDFKT